MKLWEYSWFQKLISFCRHWQWFDAYIYGKSLNLEDFVRNPAEVLRDTYAPFIFKNVRAYSLINLRIGYIQYNPTSNIPNCWSVPMGKRGIAWRQTIWTIFDLRVLNPWWTKFCNAAFFFQIAVSLWHYIPILYVSLSFRLGAWRYFQFGTGWAAELRNANDIVGYYEGTI